MHCSASFYRDREREMVTSSKGPWAGLRPDPVSYWGTPNEVFFTCAKSRWYFIVVKLIKGSVEYFIFSELNCFIYYKNNNNNNNSKMQKHIQCIELQNKSTNTSNHMRWACWILCWNWVFFFKNQLERLHWVDQYWANVGSPWNNRQGALRVYSV